MTFQTSSNVVRSALGGSYANPLNAGTAAFYSSSANSGNNLVSVHTLGNPAAVVSPNGTITFCAIGLNAGAINAGNVQNIAFFNSTAVEMFRGNVTGVGGGGDVQFSPNVQIVLSQPISFGSMVITIIA